MPLMGHGAAWAFQASNADPSTTVMTSGSTRFLLVSDSVKRNAPIVDTKGIAGTRKAFGGRARIPQATFEGTLTFEASPSILDFFIQYMMHDPTTAFELQETVDEDFDFTRDDGATVYTYRNCIVTKWTMKAASGGFVELSLDIMAKAEEIDGTAPVVAIGTGTNYEPMIAGETTISIGGATRQCDDFELSVDHGIEPKHRHSVGPTDFLPGLAVVTFTTNTVWSATLEAIYYGSGTTGLAAAVTVGRSDMQNVFTIANMVVPDNAPAVSGPGELLYGIQGVARGTNHVTNIPLTIAIDATPTP